MALIKNINRLSGKTKEKQNHGNGTRYWKMEVDEHLVKKSFEIGEFFRMRNLSGEWLEKVN